MPPEKCKLLVMGAGDGQVGEAKGAVLGGNVEFLTEDSVAELQQKIEALLENPEKYQQMKRVAEEKGMATCPYKRLGRDPYVRQNKELAI